MPEGEDIRLENLEGSDTSKKKSIIQVKGKEPILFIRLEQEIKLHYKTVVKKKVDLYLISICPLTRDDIEQLDTNAIEVVAYHHNKAIGLHDKE